MKTLKALQNENAFSTDKNNETHRFHGKTYLDTYDTIFPKVRDGSGNVLEIGVLYGGSLELWRAYFNDQATRFVGIDIDPTRKVDFGARIHIETGSQADPEFLRNIKTEFGPFKLIIDDGSHAVSHMLRSFELLWPSLLPGGIYIMEDLRCSYYGVDGGWPGMTYNPSELPLNKRSDLDALFSQLLRRMDHLEGDVSKIEFHPMIVAIHKV